jgi:hypothetical protein
MGGTTCTNGVLPAAIGFTFGLQRSPNEMSYHTRWLVEMRIS